MKKLILILLLAISFLGLKAQRIDSFPDITTMANADQLVIWQNASSSVKNITWSYLLSNITSVSGLDFETGTKYILGGEYSGYTISPSGKRIYIFGESSGYAYTGSGYILGIGNDVLGGASGAYLQAFGTSSQQYGSGDYNFSGGYYAARSITGSYNNALNAYSGQNCTGSYNNMFGSSAGYNCTGSYNDLLGNSSGYGLTGSYNRSNGYLAMYDATGSYSIADGYYNLWNNEANYNGAFGYKVLTGVYGSLPTLTHVNLKGSDNWAFGRNINYLDSTITKTVTYSFGDTIYSDSTFYTDSCLNIGIGTADPQEKLDVNGNGQMDTLIADVMTLDSRTVDSITSGTTLATTDYVTSAAPDTVNFANDADSAKGGFNVIGNLDVTGGTVNIDSVYTNFTYGGDDAGYTLPLTLNTYAQVANAAKTMFDTDVGNGSIYTVDGDSVVVASHGYYEIRFVITAISNATTFNATFQILKNGSTLIGKYWYKTIQQSIRKDEIIEAVAELYAGDYFELQVKNTSDNVDIDLVTCTLTVKKLDMNILILLLFISFIIYGRKTIKYD